MNFVIAIPVFASSAAMTALVPPLAAVVATFRSRSGRWSSCPIDGLQRWSDNERGAGSGEGELTAVRRHERRAAAIEGLLPSAGGQLCPAIGHEHDPRTN